MMALDHQRKRTSDEEAFKEQYTTPAKKTEKLKAKRRAKQKLCRRSEWRGHSIAGQLYQTINHFFPDLFEQLRAIDDCRARSDYELAELIMAGIVLFVFKQGSRNAFNNQRQEHRFRCHYRKLFKLRLPHLDTVDAVLRRLPDQALEQLKQRLIQALLEKKVLHKFRLFNRWFVVAIDGTGVMSFTHQHCDHCLHKRSKNGNVSYFHNVLEAKLITANGFSISIATEWIENPEGEYDKQDCELKAFKRLAAKLKQYYPRLPICITADGLYPNQGFFEWCRRNDWRYIVTFKEGNLPSVWEEVHALQAMTPNSPRTHRQLEGQREITEQLSWLNGIDYHTHPLNWIECLETTTDTQTGESSCTRFVQLTDLPIDATTARTISRTGRLRWKIENEGFNTQKNHGYGLQHKFSRVSWQAAKNYYQCLQIGHLINQLMVLSTAFQHHLTGKMTLAHLWKCLLGVLTYGELDEHTFAQRSQRRIQIRFVT